MRCEVSEFDVKCIKHPTEATPENAAWRILIQVKFKSDLPENWGELRAYGGSWTRTLNRTHEPKDFLDDGPPARDPSLKSQPRKTEDSTQLVAKKFYPPWGDVSGPPKKGDQEWHLDNDQHIEIFYAKHVKGIPRSVPGNRYTLPDDDNKPDYIKKALRPEEIKIDAYHIVGRDEPSRSGFQVGDYVEYWHRAEFQIRVPRTAKIMARKRLYCRVSGLYPDYEYSRRVE